MRATTLNVNGDELEVAAPAHWTLLEVLRYRLGLTGSKQGCDKGDRGACTVLMDGKPVLSCLVLAASAADANAKGTSRLKSIRQFKEPVDLPPLTEQALKQLNWSSRPQNKIVERVGAALVRNTNDTCTNGQTFCCCYLMVAQDQGRSAIRD